MGGGERKLERSSFEGEKEWERVDEIEKAVLKGMKIRPSLGEEGHDEPKKESQKEEIHLLQKQVRGLGRKEPGTHAQQESTNNDRRKKL